METTTMSMMEEVYRLVLERNIRETDPFIAIHASNAQLLNQIDALQLRNKELERELHLQRDLVVRAAANPSSSSSSAAASSSSEGWSGSTTTAALRSETRLREKLEQLQEELAQKMKQHETDQRKALEVAKELASGKDLISSHESTISMLQKEHSRKDRAMEHLTNELADAKSRTKLAEQQYVGLKDTIRILQEENDTIKKENRVLETRFVSDKEKMSTEMNKLSEMCDSLKREVEMLRSLKQQEEKRKSWFGLSSTTKTTETTVVDKTKTSSSGEDDSRKFQPTIKVVIPSMPKQKITAHTSEATCVMYDRTGADLLATGSADSTVKVWDTATGALRATMRGGGNNAILACDISNGVLVGGGSDRTCRVWNVRTQRMIHHLVGHAHKITCVRLFGGEKGVITGSADRSLKVWDISRQTYKQTTTLRHGSTANSVDVGVDSFTAVTAHLDGGIRFWDIRTGERTANIHNLHEGAVTSVQFHPTDSSKVLTNGLDSCVKLVDIRTSTPILEFKHPNFLTTYGWSTASLSPDGAYAAAGSSSDGRVFVWDCTTGEVRAELPGHDACVCGLSWGRGGSSGQQVASVDKKGALILWA